MGRNREIPPDQHWLREYLKKQGLRLTPQSALEQMDAVSWRRMQSAYRVHKAKGLAQARPQLKDGSWHRLELIRRRLGVLSLDDAVEKLGSVPDLGRLVRDALG